MRLETEAEKQRCCICMAMHKDVMLSRVCIQTSVSHVLTSTCSVAKIVPFAGFQSEVCCQHT